MVNSLTGQVVRVRDRSGHDTKGRLVSATTTEVVLQLSKSQRTIPATAIQRVTTNGDSIWGGVMIGAVVGALVQAIPIEEGPTCSGTCFSDTAAGKGVGVLMAAAFGGWLDAIHPHRAVVYEAP